VGNWSWLNTAKGILNNILDWKENYNNGSNGSFK
jgi:hypothetical protein